MSEELNDALTNIENFRERAKLKSLARPTGQGAERFVKAAEEVLKASDSPAKTLEAAESLVASIRKRVLTKTPKRESVKLKPFEGSGALSARLNENFEAIVKAFEGLSRHAAMVDGRSRSAQEIALEAKEQVGKLAGLCAEMEEQLRGGHNAIVEHLKTFDTGMDIWQAKVEGRIASNHLELENRILLTERAIELLQDRSSRHQSRLKGLGERFKILEDYLFHEGFFGRLFRKLFG